MIAPWHDYNGEYIYEGDLIRHPSGQAGRVFFLGGASDPEDQWWVKYEDDITSRLCLQVGDKGRAVVVRGVRQ